MIVNGEVAGLAIATLILHLHIPAFMELYARSKRYHRAALGLYPAAFAAYGLVAAVGIWMTVVYRDPASVQFAALAVYCGLLSVIAMVKFPPRSACRSLPDALPEIERMLKTPQRVDAV